MKMFFLIVGIVSCVAGLLLLRRKPPKNNNVKDQLVLHYAAVVGLLLTGVAEVVTFAILVVYA